MILDEMDMDDSRYSSYSVLISVYNKERPEYLRAALKSIMKQSLPADEVVLVCDGPLGSALEAVIDEFRNIVTLLRLPENAGLGKALAEGMKLCRNEWIARMDSDDIAAAERCRLQMEFLRKHPEVDILSGVAAEFQGDCLTEEDAAARTVSYKTLPLEHKELAVYLKDRNPINHPCVMLRKSKALAAGGYQPCCLFEDYDLWIRMYQNGCIFANLPSVLLYMRVNEMHSRRGGIYYARSIVKFRTKMLKNGLLTPSRYLYTTAARVAVSLMPDGMRRRIYDIKLREH